MNDLNTLDGGSVINVLVDKENVDYIHYNYALVPKHIDWDILSVYQITYNRSQGIDTWYSRNIDIHRWLFKKAMYQIV